MPSEFLNSPFAGMLPAPIVAVGVLMTLRKLAWRRALRLTMCLSLLGTTLRLAWPAPDNSWSGIACLGNCGPHWLAASLLSIYLTELVGGLILAAMLTAIVMRFGPRPALPGGNGAIHP